MVCFPIKTLCLFIKSNPLKPPWIPYKPPFPMVKFNDYTISMGRKHWTEAIEYPAWPSLFHAPKACLARRVVAVHCPNSPECWRSSRPGNRHPFCAATYSQTRKRAMFSQTGDRFVDIFISGWWFEPLWKILVNWDDHSQYMENKKCSKPPTSFHKPVTDLLTHFIGWNSWNP